jgi:hypothetical protein
MATQSLILNGLISVDIRSSPIIAKWLSVFSTHLLFNSLIMEHLYHSLAINGKYLNDCLDIWEIESSLFMTTTQDR